MVRVNELGLLTEAAVVATWVGDCLVVIVPPELGGRCLEDLERETLSALGSRPIRGLIFELAGVQFMDSHEFEFLQRIARVAQYLAVSTVFSGIRPGIIAHLANSNLDLGSVPSAFELSEALALFSVAYDK